MRRVGIIGMGQMGKGLYHQISLQDDIECVAVTDIHEDRCSDVKCDVCIDADELVERDDVDVVIDATSSIVDAAGFDWAAITNSKHLVMMNAEADLIFGPSFMKVAKEQVVAYTSCGGDQPAVIVELVREVLGWGGFELVVAGNIKGFQDRYSNPDKIKPEADKRGIDYRMASAMTDGTKMQIEQALVANCLGLRTWKTGMGGPLYTPHVKTYEYSRPEHVDWLGRIPVVDYVVGAEPNGGVFIVVRCDDPFQQEMLRYYKMGDGPFYTFYRHCHLCHIEAMDCIRDAYAGRSLLQPTHGFKTNVMAYAKRDLRAHQTLDGIGCFDCYGLIENMPSKGLPVCLTEGVRIVRDIKKDEPILMSDVEEEFLGRIDFATYWKGL
jgi:predicted homoserine dehydrogenase-like protein